MQNELADELERSIEAWQNSEPDATTWLAAYTAGAKDTILAALRNNRDDAQAITDLEAEIERLREALKATLNYIENTECELGIKLDCGERARQALEGEG